MVRRGSGSDGGDDAPVAAGQPFAELAKNPWAVILIAAITGTGSGTFFGRPDPFTGTEGRALQARIERLEQMQSLDNQHRTDSRECFERIRDIERSCDSLEEKVRNDRRRIDEHHH